MAFNSAVAGQRPTAAQWNDYVFRRVVADCTASTRPSSPVEGQPIYETDTDKVLVHNGTSWIELGKLGTWTTYTPTWSSTGTPPVLNNGTLNGWYQKLFGNVGLVHVELTAGSTSTFGTGTLSYTLPSGWTAARAWCLSTGTANDNSGATYFPIEISCTPGTALMYPNYKAVVSSIVQDIGMTATAPFTMATSDYVHFTALLELS